MSNPLTLETFPEIEGPRVALLADLLGELDADADRRHRCRAEGRPLGPVPPLPELAEELGGEFPIGLAILHGSPGSGKTAFALQSSACCQCPALYVTFEMSPVELLRRITARVTRTYLGKLKSGEFTPAHIRGLAMKAAEACSNLAILDGTRGPVDLASIEAAAGALRGRIGGDHLFIVVDSLHAWADAEQGDAGEYESIGAVCRALGQLAERQGAAVLAIAERNRANSSKHRKTTDHLAAGAGSRKLEYKAEAVLSLESDPDSYDQATGAAMVTLTVAKNRNGSPGKELELKFTGKLQEFTEA